MTTPSRPTRGGGTLSQEKLRALNPDLAGFKGFARSLWRWIGGLPPYRVEISEHLMHGDARAAIVMSVDPLLIAAYTDELDCIALLYFPDWLVKQYQLEPRSRLLTVNTYKSFETWRADADLDFGPENLGRWAGFTPLIGDFLTDDAAALALAKGRIAPTEWNRTVELARAYMMAHPGQSRDGLPPHSGTPIIKQS